MKLVQLTKDMAHQGLSKGDVINVDQRSAEALIKRGDAEEYDRAAAEKAEQTDTIDDIASTASRGRAVMSAVRVGYADPGPASASVEEAEDAPGTAQEPVHSTDLTASAKKAAPKKATSAASGAQPAGGDAGGGDK